jgi:hypothetical protein
MYLESPIPRLSKLMRAAPNRLKRRSQRAFVSWEGSAEALLTKPIDFAALRSEMDLRIAA